MLNIKYFAESILLILLFAVVIMGQQQNGVYNFPLKPGMPEWRTLKTHNEMLKTLQLPDDIKKVISTKALLKTCLNYPLFSDLWAYDNIKSGFVQLRKDFNGFNELLKRTDAFAELLKLYEKMEPSLIGEKSDLIEKGKYTAEFCKLEIIITQPEILKNISLYDKNFLLKVISSKHGKMLTYREFDIRNIESNIYLMGLVLYEMGDYAKTKIEKNNKVNTFIKTSKFLDKDTILEIISLSQNYLKY